MQRTCCLTISIIKQVGLNIPNAAHEAEKKTEQETLEKRIGLLNYLVDKDSNMPPLLASFTQHLCAHLHLSVTQPTENEEPWYLKTDPAEESAKSKRKKEVTDPLKDMQHYVAIKKKQTTTTGEAAAPVSGDCIGPSGKAPISPNGCIGPSGKAPISPKSLL